MGPSRTSIAHGLLLWSVLSNTARAFTSVAPLHRPAAARLLPLSSSPAQQHAEAHPGFAEGHKNAGPNRRTLSLSLPDLAAVVGGTGRAKAVWAAVRQGVDPLTAGSSSSSSSEVVTPKTRAALRAHGITRFVPGAIETATPATDGTTKLLIRFDDGLAVESVLIPHLRLPRTTLCVSTQVGCDRGCAFCATGRMGLFRNLTACEIAAQFFWAYQYASTTAFIEKPLTNVVFMGMGDAGVNCVESARAAETLTDDLRFGLAKAKVTLSTVGPTPDAWRVLAKAPCALAWSVHSAEDGLRRRLVPTSSHSSLSELRQGLLDAIRDERPAVRTRTMMVAATLIDGVNDGVDDARQLAEFVGPIVDVCAKLNVDLIPVNAVDHAPQFRRPDDARLTAFVETVKRHEPRVHVAVRVTRGDDEDAACGQLAVKELSRGALQSARKRSMRGVSSSSFSSSSGSNRGRGVVV